MSRFYSQPNKELYFKTMGVTLACLFSFVAGFVGAAYFSGFNLFA